MSDDKEIDEMMRRMRTFLRISPSRANIKGIDPDNAYEIQQHERESVEFEIEMNTLQASILYVHGFASSGDSGTARTLQKFLPKSRVIAPDLPLDPDEALALLRRIVDEEKVDVVVGTSMGGMFAQKLRGVPKVLVNPSFHVSESMRLKIGTVPFFKRRRDGATEFEVTPALCDAYENLESGQFDNLSDEEVRMTYGLFGNEDDVVNCEAEYDSHYSKKMIFRGGHRLTPDAIHDYVVEAILQLLNHNEPE